jgi:hypothetical protein
MRSRRKPREIRKPQSTRLPIKLSNRNVTYCDDTNYKYLLRNLTRSVLENGEGEQESRPQQDEFFMETFRCKKIPTSICHL